MVALSVEGVFLRCARQERFFSGSYKLGARPDGVEVMPFHTEGRSSVGSTHLYIKGYKNLPIYGTGGFVPLLQRPLCFGKAIIREPPFSQQKKSSPRVPKEK